MKNENIIILYFDSDKEKDKKAKVTRLNWLKTTYKNRCVEMLHINIKIGKKISFLSLISADNIIIFI